MRYNFKINDITYEVVEAPRGATALLNSDGTERTASLHQGDHKMLILSEEISLIDMSVALGFLYCNAWGLETSSLPEIMLEEERSEPIKKIITDFLTFKNLGEFSPYIIKLDELGDE